MAEERNFGSGQKILHLKSPHSPSKSRYLLVLALFIESRLPTFRRRPQKMDQPAHSGTWDRLISERLAAEILGFSADTLRRLSQRGEGPARRRVSPRRIGYKLSEVEAYRDGKWPKPVTARR